MVIEIGIAYKKYLGAWKWKTSGCGSSRWNKDNTDKAKIIRKTNKIELFKVMYWDENTAGTMIKNINGLVG